MAVLAWMYEKVFADHADDYPTVALAGPDPINQAAEVGLFSPLHRGKHTRYPSRQRHAGV